MAKYCEYCGTALGDGVMFCPGCGARVEEEGKSSQSNNFIPDSGKESTQKAGQLSPTEISPAQSIETKPAASKKKSKNWLGYGVAAAAVLILAVLFLGDAGSDELVGVLPLARADVEKFMSENDLVYEEGMYSKDGIWVTLNERGNIDGFNLTSPGLAFCGIRVGDTFTAENDSRKFSENGYTFLLEDGGIAFYGKPNLEEGKDELVFVTLSDKDVVQSIGFIGSGARDIYYNDDSDYGEDAQESEIVPFDNVGDYVLPDSNSRYLTEADLAGLDTDMLWLAKNEIYARHGKIFASDEMSNYFNSKSWYHGEINAKKFKEDVFNAYEKANLELIDAFINGGAPVNSAEESMAMADYSGYYDLVAGEYRYVGNVSGGDTITASISIYTDGPDVGNLEISIYSAGVITAQEHYEISGSETAYILSDSFGNWFGCIYGDSDGQHILIELYDGTSYEFELVYAYRAP